MIDNSGKNSHLSQKKTYFYENHNQKDRWVSKYLLTNLKAKKIIKYQPNSKGGTHSPPISPLNLQCSTIFKIPNDLQGAPKWPTGSGKGSIHWLLGAVNNFSSLSFVIWGAVYDNKLWQRKWEKREKRFVRIEVHYQILWLPVETTDCNA